jgi:putative copper export protein
MKTLGTALGRVEALRVGLAWLALWAFSLARRERLALVFAAAALVVSGAIGHPAAIVPEWAIPAKVLHLLGAALWLGGLLWLATTDRGAPLVFARSAARVSSIALWAVIVVAFTGVVETRLFLAHFSDIVRSAYGIGVLAKVTGLGVLVVFGAHHRYRVLPGLTESADCVRMAHSVTREVMVMAIVVLLGGFLAYVPPPAARPLAGSTSSLESNP